MRGTEQGDVIGPTPLNEARRPALLDEQLAALLDTLRLDC